MIVLWVFVGLLALLMILLLVALVRTLRMPTRQSTYVPAADEREALRLAETVCRADPADRGGTDHGRRSVLPDAGD